jgi:hypothetical protein
MGQPKWYEGDSEASNFSDQTTGGGGGGAFEKDSTSDTLDTGNDILKTTNQTQNKTSQNQTQGKKTWEWTPDPNAARKAWEHAGRPDTPDVNAWFKNAVEAGSYLQNGESSSETAYNKSGYSRPGAADITGMRAWAKQHGMSEDFDRWDEGQLMAWESQKDPSCPPNTPYQAYDGSGCIEKPIDSNNPNAQGGGGGGGGGGGQGGGGGAGGANTPAAAVQNRPDYKPDTNYLTQRQIGSNYGPGGGPPRSTPPATGGVDPASGKGMPEGYKPVGTSRPNPTTQPKEFVLSRDQANNQPGGTTIPSSVLWKTGM